MASHERKAIIVGKGSVKEASAAAAAPFWVLRHHSPHAIHYLRLIRASNGGSKDVVLLAAGDSQGRFSLTALRDYRPRFFWQAHKEGILGLDLLQLNDKNVLISSGRDNQLHLFTISTLQELTSAVLPSRIQEELPVPYCQVSMGINSLNYCPFSAVRIKEGDQSKGKEVLVAVPHTIDSGYIDIYSLPSQRRILSAVGKADIETKGVQASSNRAAIVMSLSLFDQKGVEDTRCIVAGYEDGSVKCWKIAGVTVTLEWSERKHLESVMAVAVSKNQDFCVSVGADRQVIRYDMKQGSVTYSKRSNSFGHACVAIREDDQIIATGGWDGCIRLYDAELVQSASLRYHKDTVQALSFVQERDLVRFSTRDEGGEESSDEESDDGLGSGDADYSTILVSGGKEGRICLWRT